MSTKAIREALDLLGKFITDTGGCDHAGNICVCGEGIVLRDAQDELEAIEKAARTWDNDDCGVFVGPCELYDMRMLLRTIAKQEP
jgi:hypothetical protein